jgi:hypothetical protein
MKNNKFIAIAILIFFFQVSYGQKHAETHSFETVDISIEKEKPKEKSREAREPREHHGGERDRNDTKTNNSQNSSHSSEASRVNKIERAREMEIYKAKMLAKAKQYAKEKVVNETIMKILEKIVKGWGKLSKGIAGGLIGDVLFPNLLSGPDELEFERKNREADLKRVIEIEVQKVVDKIEKDFNNKVDNDKLRFSLGVGTKEQIDHMNELWKQQEYERLNEYSNDIYNEYNSRKTVKKQGYSKQGTLPPKGNHPPGIIIN